MQLRLSFSVIYIKISKERQRLLHRRCDHMKRRRIPAMLTETNLTFLEKALPFWEKLSPSEKNILTAHGAELSCKKGETLHSADYKCLGLLLVRSGTLRVCLLSEDGREITLYRIREGELCILSASCILSSITFDVHIDAVTDCELIQVSSSAISLLMHDNIYVEAFANRLAAERFSDVMWAMQQILFMSFDKRLAMFLLDESVSLGTDELKLTHEEIAKLIGSAREVVSRMLKYFSAEGYVELSRGAVKLTDKKALRSLLG